MQKQSKKFCMKTMKKNTLEKLKKNEKNVVHMITSSNYILLSVTWFFLVDRANQSNFVCSLVALVGEEQQVLVYCSGREGSHKKTKKT